MVYLVGNADLICLLDFNEVTKVQEFYLFDLFAITAHLNDYIFCPQVTIHSSGISYILQKHTNLENEIGELLLAIVPLVENLIEIRML